MRRRVTLLLSSAIAISYFDRQTLAVAISAIQREIPLTNTQFSQLQAWFLIGYTAMYAGGGKLREINFRLDLMMRHLDYSTREGRNHSVELSTGLAALARFEDAAAKGFGNRDLSAVIEPLRESR